MRITITRLLEAAKYTATEVGKEIPEFFTYMSEFVEQTIRSLRNGLTFGDNFACQEASVTLQHNVGQVVQATKAVKYILVGRVYGSSKLTGFNWSYNSNNQLIVTATFDPAPTGQVQADLIMFF